MWTMYRVRWEFITQLCASVPGTSSLIEGWLKSRAPRARPAQSKSLDEIAAEVVSTLAEPEEIELPTTLVFQRVPLTDGTRALAVRMATIKAHLKDCAYQIQTYTAGYAAGEKSLRAKLAHTVYWPATAPVMLYNGPPFVPVLRMDGTPFAEPTGVREKAIHIQTMQGPRSALKAFEYCENAVLEFPLAVLTAPDRKVKVGTGKEAKIAEKAGRPVIDEDDMKTVMLYGGMHGYAGERSEDGGRYAFTITKEESRG